jgi:hypothetical protein
MFCCKISVALEGSFFLLSKEGVVDCFPSYEEAFIAGTRALLTCINKRIVLPKKSAPKPTEVCAAIRPPVGKAMEFGFFGGYD